MGFLKFVGCVVGGMTAVVAAPVVLPVAAGAAAVENAAKGIKAAAGGPGINGQIFVIISIIALFIVAFYGLKREKNR